MGWDLLAVTPWLVFFATGAAMVGVYAAAGLVGRDAGRVGELFEGLFELASVRGRCWTSFKSSFRGL